MDDLAENLRHQIITEMCYTEKNARVGQRYPGLPEASGNGVIVIVGGKASEHSMLRMTPQFHTTTRLET